MKTFIAAVLTILVAVALFVASATLIMVVWGALGAAFDIQGSWRTIDFGQALLVTLALSIVSGFLKRG